MTPKTTLRTTGFAALLLCAGPALAFAAGTSGQPAATGTTSTTMPTPGTAGTQVQTHMTENEVKTSLGEQGYSDITNLKQSGSNYTADAKRYGQEEHNLQINASTGKVMNQQALNEDQVKQLLKDQGYSDINHVKQSGHDFTANAKKNGSEMHVTVDAQNGMVSPQAG